MSDTITEQESILEEHHFHYRFPLAFDLWDLEEQPLLSSMGPAGQTLLLRLSNFGDHDIELKEPAGDATTAHFTLRLRQGILAAPEMIQIEGPGGQWGLRHTRDHQVDDLQIRAPAGFRLPPGQECILFLHKVHSISQRGTRNSRIVLAYDHLMHGPRPLSGYRQSVIGVVQQYPPESRGEAGARRRPLPLRLGFAGSNTILTSASPDAEGRASHLLLQVSNLSERPLRFQRIPANDDLSSRIILAFEVQDEGVERGWALGTPSQVSAIEPFLADWEAIRFPDAEKVVWIFTPQQPEVVLGAEKALEISINNIRTSLPAGPTNLYVTLENVPDPQGDYYADQSQILTVQKSPLVYNDQRVGIGAAQPIGHLELAAADGSRLRFGNQEDTRVNVLTTAQPLAFRSTAGSFHFIHLASYDQPTGGRDPELAQINNQGLKVRGRIRDKSGLVMPVGSILPFAGQEEPEGWLLCNGQQVDKLMYPDLFDVIGYIYSTDDTGNKFNVPDLGSRTPMGLVPGDEDFGSLNNTGKGEVTLSVNQMPGHTHDVELGGGSHNHNLQMRFRKYDDGDFNALYWDEISRDYQLAYGGEHGHKGTTKSTGGNQPIKTLPPYVVVNYIIKY